jgi:hypothetical protein
LSASLRNEDALKVGVLVIQQMKIAPAAITIGVAGVCLLLRTGVVARAVLLRDLGCSMVIS